MTVTKYYILNRLDQSTISYTLENLYIYLQLTRGLAVCRFREPHPSLKTNHLIYQTQTLLPTPQSFRS